MKRLTFLPILFLASATFTFAQNANQAAVDTLTKDVATAVFSAVKQPRAQEIYGQLLDCGDGCDAQTIIRTVGGWDAVGVKIEELSELKNTARFVGMSASDANTAIRKQLAQFYARYKDDRNYGKPLSPAVQQQILAKIDRLLPPAEVAESSSTVATPQLDEASANTVQTDEETSINPADLQLSQLERKVKEEQKKGLWMEIISAIIGLLVGAGAVYLLLYRTTKAEVQRLLNENTRLSQSLDAARRPKPTNEPRQAQNDYRKQPEPTRSVEPTPVAARSTGTQANQPVTPPATPRPPVQQDEPILESTPVSEPVRPVEPPAVPTQPPVMSPPPAPSRNDVFYCPPPDPNGQFSSDQMTDTLSPESAYRFSVNATNPNLASFRFEADPGRVARFLTYRNYMIEPACESENSYTSTHTRVVMRRDGEAVLENGTWRVKTKALIRYE